ncbi:hypothetical protein PLESTM_001177800 [Pleodorina starrii]|nr:hypothetical protein PLESTM_001177800 [Pleodorina starrii]
MNPGWAAYEGFAYPPLPFRLFPLPQGYGAYLAVLYSMVALLMGNVGLCVWVAWCFKEHKFPVVWPIQVLRVFSSVFFQAFDVASLNLLQLGISCNYSGDAGPRLYMNLFPSYSCTSTPHVLHAVVSALSLVLFVAIAMLLNMAEVEVNPLSRRPLALGHSGAEVTAFAIKAMMTLVDVFIGYRKVAACVYMALALALAWQSLRWSPHLVAWVNYLKSGVAVTMVWCCISLMLLLFKPGVKSDKTDEWADTMTILLLVGLGPAFCAGALTSFLSVRNMTRTSLKAMANAKPEIKQEDILTNLDDPRDVEIVARCCRVWKDRYTLDTEAVNQAHHVIKAGLAMFPNSAYMVLLHGNFMIDVLGVSQSGSSRIEDARKLNPGLMCRFIMFVRHQQATQKAAGGANDGSHMDLLGYVEYQRKQRMVVRLHREALQAMCNFWRALDASRVSFMHLSRALGKIESSVSQAQTAYRVVLENYGHNPKLVRLYGKFLQTIKNDPWRASEYFSEADRLEEIKNGDARGPLLPDGTPLGRMDEMATAVLVINSTGEVQMANRHTHMLFGYRRGTLEAKPLATLLAPHTARRVAEQLAQLVSANAMGADEGASLEDVVVGMHYDRLAFAVKLFIRKVSGVGEDSTFVVMMEPVPPVPGTASLWVAPNGTVAACDPQFVSNFGWRASEVNGSNLMAFISVSSPERQASGDEEFGPAARGPSIDGTGDTMTRLMSTARRASSDLPGQVEQPGSTKCLIAHKYDSEPMTGMITVYNTNSDIPVLEVRIKLDSAPAQLLVVNRRGAVVHVSTDLVGVFKDAHRAGMAGNKFGSVAGGAGGGTAALLQSADSGGGGGGGARFGGPGVGQAGVAVVGAVTGADDVAGYTLFDFMPAPWKEMHMKFLKDSATVSPPARNQWSCRKATLPGPTLELRTAAGKPLYMHVSVANAEVAGETSHVVRLAKSSLESALAERRLRLGVTGEGLVSSVSEGSAKLFGLEPGQIIGRGIWEIVEDSATTEAGTGRLGTPGPRMLTTLVTKSLSFPDYSWRVQVSPPQKPAGRVTGVLELAAAARASMARLAIMQVNVEATAVAGTGTGPTSGGGGCAQEDLSIFVDLWPIATVTGVLDLDSGGRVRGVLEERLRPVGLLFGIPSQSLVGSALGELVALPPGRAKPGDLLSLHGAKKSSLKSTKKESSNKVGPVHVLQGIHVDGRPVLLDVQVVGKPGPNQPLHAILRFHIAPMLPGATSGSSTAGAGAGAAAAAAGAGTALRLPGFPLAPPALAAFGKTASAGGASVIAAAAAAVAAAGTGSGGLGASMHGSMRLAQGQSPAVNVSRLGSQAVEASGDGKGAVGLMGDEQKQKRKQAPAAGGRSGSLNFRALSGLPLGGILEETGYTPESDQDGPMGRSTATCPPPDVLIDGMPLPGVTLTSAAGKAAHLAGRSKLADLVKNVGSGGGSGGSGSGRGAAGADAAARDSKGSSDAAKPATPQRGSSFHLTGGRPVDLRAAGAMTPPPKSPFSDMAADLDDSPLMRGTTKGSVAAPAMDLQSVGGSDEHDSDREARKALRGNGRISTWVASKGAFYQNTVKPDTSDDDGRSRRSGELSDNDAAGPDVVARVQVGGLVGPDTSFRAAAPMSPGMRSEFGGYPDDDVASEGGQSAMSAQSASGGAEYKRGKRFRKLIKLMDSSQAQQVQQRFRTHALVTVAVLATVHIVCFALMVTAIQSQRASMLNLGHNGEAQRYMHQIMTDVRSLDVISMNKTLPNLYTAADTQMFVDRLSVNAEIVKGRLNGILDGHHSSDTKVMELFYYTLAPAWNGKDLDGSDLYTNLTVWDFSTRFYTMTTNIVQHYQEWLAEGIRIADTDAGQFLLKSGPDIFRMSRKILDELLFEAAANVHWVDTLQLVFLAVEGTVISSLAALYLAYLLRAVAAQRLKLYGTFLVVPLGLTRALASQNTNLLVDDDDDDDMSDEDERTPPTVADDNGEDEDGGDAVADPKAKRRATLNVSDTGEGVRRVMGRSTSFATPAGGGGGGGGDGVERSGASGGMDRLVSRQRSTSLESRGEKKGWRGFRALQSLWRRGRSVVMPMPLSGSNGPTASAMPLSKRKLRDDSHETFVMMMPFVFWSAVVITIYSIAVIHMKGVVEVVAVHSVSNFMSARTYRTVFYSQELAVVEDPQLLTAKRAALKTVIKLVTDAWYTLQLGENAYRAAGPNTERFPLVKEGLAYASPALSEIFYGTGKCHRMKENLPCPGPDNRFYQVTHTGLDSMMQQFMMSVTAMATNKSMTPEGLEDEHFDFVYNVGAKDLLDGTIAVEDTHYTTIIGLFHRIMVLHVVLFLVLWVVFAGFLILLLNPLLKRISKERRRIAELMSQLPLELDVEKLVARALGTATNAASPGLPGGGVMPGQTAIGDTASEGGEEPSGRADATNKWKAIIRSASSGLKSRPSFTNGMSGSLRKG